MADRGVLLFGQIAVQNRFASAADVERAVAEQMRLQASGVTRSIGEIMIGLKLITPEQLAQILEVQEFVRTREEDKSLGRLAVANGFLTESQVQDCLETQRVAWKGQHKLERIGEIMVRAGILSEQQRDALLKAQRRLQQMDAAVTRSRTAPDPRPAPKPAPPPPPPPKPVPPPPVTDSHTVTPTRRLAPGEAEANARAAAAAARRFPVARSDEEGSGLIALRTCAYCQGTTDGERSRCIECGHRSCIYCGTVAVDGQDECGHCKARLTE